jgi:hypothetical protein
LEIAMPRPHIEFLHAQQLPWTAAPFAGAAWPGSALKFLSRDSESGACSVLWRLPPATQLPPFRLAALAEVFVLDGAFRLHGEDYGLDCYTVLPAGMPWSDLYSDEGAVLLAFFDAEPWSRPVDEGLSNYHSSLHVPRIDTHRTPWTSHDIDPSVQFLRLTHKVLRNLPATGERTILLATGAQTHPADWHEAQLRHDCVEEMYLLGGDIIGERGTIYEGGYFWRPPRIWHGPFGSRRGSLSIIRFAEGRHANEWGDRQLPFSLIPAHAPALPAAAPDGVRAAWVPPRY